MRVHVVIDYEPGRMWDAIHIEATDQDSRIDWYHRDVFVGQDWNIALNKAQTELEALLIKLGVISPGLIGTTERIEQVSDPSGDVESRSGPRRRGR